MPVDEASMRAAGKAAAAIACTQRAAQRRRDRARPATDVKGLAVGVVELVVVSLLTRRQTAAAGLDDEAPRPPASIALRRTALFEIVAGVIFLVIGLLS